MKGTNLTRAQIIVIGVACLFGVPICLGIVVGHFVDFWSGVVAAIVAIAIIAFIAQRWEKGIGKQDNKPDD